MTFTSAVSEQSFYRAKAELCNHCCLSVCHSDYWKSDEPISLKLGAMTGLPIGRTYLLVVILSRIWIPHHFSIFLNIS